MMLHTWWIHITLTGPYNTYKRNATPSFLNIVTIFMLASNFTMEQ